MILGLLMNILESIKGIVMDETREALNQAIHQLREYRDSQSMAISGLVLGKVSESEPIKSIDRAINLCKAAQDNEQKPAGYVDEFGNFENNKQQWMDDEPNVKWMPLYTSPPNQEAEIARLRKVLKFYANPKYYKVIEGVGESYIMSDGGHDARKALEVSNDE